MSGGKIFKRKRNIERATSYKLEYCFCKGGELKKEFRDFKSIKALAQWELRSGSYSDFMAIKRLALIDEIWEPFATIGKKSVTLSDLICIVEDLKSSILPK